MPNISYILTNIHLYIVGSTVCKLSNKPLPLILNCLLTYFFGNKISVSKGPDKPVRTYNGPAANTRHWQKLQCVICQSPVSEVCICNFCPYRFDGVPWMDLKLIQASKVNVKWSWMYSKEIDKKTFRYRYFKGKLQSETIFFTLKRGNNGSLRAVRSTSYS